MKMLPIEPLKGPVCGKKSDFSPVVFINLFYLLTEAKFRKHTFLKIFPSCSSSYYYYYYYYCYSFNLNVNINIQTPKYFSNPSGPTILESDP